MKPLLHLAFAAVVIVAGSNPAGACWFWPWGTWGAGYYGYPVVYGYRPAPLYPSYYTVGYAPVAWGSPASGCCISCCETCSASGACIGTATDSLKPATDPKFNRSNNDYENDPSDNTGVGSGASGDNSSHLGRDDFRAPRDRSSGTRLGPADRSDLDNSGAPMFGTGSDSDPTPRISNKPPMPEIDPNESSGAQSGTSSGNPETTPASSGSPNPADAGKSGDGKTFLQESPEEKTGIPQPQAQRLTPTLLASQPSSLGEVLRPKRLASRSLPAVKISPVNSQYAGRTNADRASAVPVRWIGGPDPENRARL